MGVNPAPEPDPLAALLRWEAAGGEWVVRAPDGASTVVDLTTCDGGDVMGRLVSSRPDFVAHVNAGTKGERDR